MNKYFIKLVLIIVVSIQFGCENKNNKLIQSETHNIDWLIKQSDNKKLNLSEKFYYSFLAENALKKKKYDSISKIQYQNLILAYYNLDDKTKFVNICKELMQKSSKIEDFETIGVTKFNLASFYLKKFETDSAFFYYNNAEKILKKLKNQPYLEYILVAKSNILWSKKDFAGAEVLAIKALKISKTTKNNDIIYSCYLTLGNSLTGLNNFDSAIKYYQKALEANENLKDKSSYKVNQGQVYNYLSNIYQEQDLNKKSIQFAKKGLSIDNFKIINPNVFCYLTNNLANAKLKLGDKSALKQFRETLKIGDSLESVPIQITSKTHLGEFYLAEKDTLKANFYLKNAQIQAHKNAVFEDELKILQLLAKANPKSEAFYSDRYIVLSDSLQEVERATRDKFARIEFETEEISTQKKIVETKNNLLTNSIWFLLAISILVILLIVLLFKQNSQKAKTRELLLKQDQQDNNEIIYDLMLSQQQKLEEGKNFEKQRISLELHDGVMGKLSAVRLNLFATFHKLGLVEDEHLLLQIEEIQSVEKEIRSIAHDLNNNLFANNAKFVAIVQSLFDKIQKHATIDLKLQISDEVNWDLINITIKINLYRIIQEALQNIEKHADAQKVLVLITKPTPDKINITISDDGKGFDSQQKKAGIGIKNMQKRVADLNGVIEIFSQKQNGTKINLTLPI